MDILSGETYGFIPYHYKGALMTDPLDKEETTKQVNKNSKKMIRMRYIWAVVMVVGLILLLILEPQMGHRGVGIGQVFGVLLGGLMLFSGGIGTAVTTLFIQLEKKPKNKAW